MQVAINLDLLNDTALNKISEDVSAVGSRFGSRGALMKIKLPSGSILLAMPISRINPLAPPRIQIKGKPDYSEDNRSGHRRIANVLRPACKSKHLPEAIKMMKSAIDAISK